MGPSLLSSTAENDMPKNPWGEQDVLPPESLGSSTGQRTWCGEPAMGKNAESEPALPWDGLEQKSAEWL